MSKYEEPEHPILPQLRCPYCNAPAVYRPDIDMLYCENCFLASEIPKEYYIEVKSCETLNHLDTEFQKRINGRH